MTWSVRDAGDEAVAARVLAELSRVSRDACAAHFDEDAGYSIVHRRSWGALEGSSTEIRRGSFRALVGVQRFVRRSASDASGSEFRVVASAKHRGSEALVRRPERRAAAWLGLACATGVAGMGATGIIIAGLMSTWAQVMLVIPLLMVWRLTLVARIADDLHRDAHRRALTAVADDRPGASEDLARWRHVLATMAVQREAVSEAFRTQGFRTPGALPGTVAALAAGPQQPARIATIAHLTMPPLGRVTSL